VMEKVREVLKEGRKENRGGEPCGG